jgi:2'-5' RNA ligase
MEIVEEEKKNYYTIFSFKEHLDIPNNHTTLCYHGMRSPMEADAIQKIIEDYFNENMPVEFEATFDKVEYFGPDKDIRVLTTEEKEKFLPELRDLLSQYNGSEFKVFRPHYTSDEVEAPKTVVLDKLHFCADEYLTVKNFSLMPRPV